MRCLVNLCCSKKYFDFLSFSFFLEERNSINCIGGIFQWLSYLDTFTETPTASNLDYQGLSATPETPETVQQHILDDVVTSGSGNGKKSRKRRISECLIVYHFTVIQVMKVSDFFPQEVKMYVMEHLECNNLPWESMEVWETSVSSKPVLFQRCRESKGSIFFC